MLFLAQRVIPNGCLSLGNEAGTYSNRSKVFFAEAVC